MPIGMSNRTQLAFIKEVTPGITPASPALQIMRFNSESLNSNNTTLQSDEIMATRDIADLTLSDRSISGSINGEFSGATFDVLLEAALMSDATWTANVKTGTTIAVTASGFTDSGSGFLTSGFQVGQFVKVVGATNPLNNTFYRILTVVAGTITTYPAPAATQVAGPSITISGSSIKSGTKDASFTIQKAFLDLTNVSYNNFRGCRVNSMGLSLSAGEKVMLDLGIMGQTSEVTTTAISGQSFLPKTTTKILNAVTNANNLVAVSAGMTTAVKFTTLSLAYNNQMRELKAIGTFGSIDIRPGTIQAETTINPYFEDIQMLNAFLANESFHLSWSLTSQDGYTYFFSLGNVKFTSQEIVAGGKDQDMIISANTLGLREPNGGCVMRIDRFVP